jgi:hypothetical protein
MLPVTEFHRRDRAQSKVKPEIFRAAARLAPALAFA